MLPLYGRIATLLTDYLPKNEHGRQFHVERDFVNPAKEFKTGGSRLFVLVGSLGMLIIALCAHAITYGHFSSRSNPISFFGLGNCADAACFKAMTPGLTSWADAQKMLATLDNTLLFDNQILAPIGSDGEAHLYESMGGTRVGQIYIAVPSETFLSVGEIVAEYGVPCGISIQTYPVSNFVTLHYPLLYVRTQNAGSRLTVDIPIQMIVFRDPAYPHSCQENSGR